MVRTLRSLTLVCPKCGQLVKVDGNCECYLMAVRNWFKLR